MKKGDVIGRFFGRAEFGQRALGNRSILASIVIQELLTKLTKKLSQEIWMPFALSITDEDFKKYFLKNNSIDPFYMTTCFKLRQNVDFKKFQNVIHPADRTGRPQVVKLKDNYKYYDLLKALKKLLE